MLVPVTLCWELLLHHDAEIVAATPVAIVDVPTLLEIDFVPAAEAVIMATALLLMFTVVTTMATSGLLLYVKVKFKLLYAKFLFFIVVNIGLLPNFTLKKQL